MNEEGPRLGDRLVEAVTIALIGLATVASAWCAYQAAQWSNDSSGFSQVAANQRDEATRQYSLATQELGYDTSSITLIAQATAAGNTRLAAFYQRTLVRPAFRPTVEAWISTVRAGGSPTPLVEDQAYLQAQLRPYNEATTAASIAEQQSRDAASRSSAYVAATILLAAALFLLGVLASFRFRGARVVLLAFALALLGFAASRLATLPVSSG